MHEDWEFLHDLLDISIYRHFRSNIEDSDSEGRSKPVLEVVQFFYSSALSPVNGIGFSWLPTAALQSGALECTHQLFP
jgi:hypothetical protein